MEENYKIEELLITSPGVLNYNAKSFFEVKPHRKSPIFVNIKNTLSNIPLRNMLTTNLLNNLPSDIDFVCGIESGGSYYASVIADKLQRPLVLYRYNDKKYAEKGSFVGAIPIKRRIVLIIDDVIVSGATIEPAIHRLRKLGCEIYVRTIFSFGHNDFIERRLSVDLHSIITVNTLLNAAVREKILSIKDVTFLKKFTLQQKAEFVLKYTQHR